MRDYKRYLSSDPTPSDYSDVQAELTDYTEQRRQEMRQPPGSSTYTANGSRQTYGQPQSGASAGASSRGPYAQAGASSSGAGGSSGSSNRPGSGGAGLGAGKGPHPHANFWRDEPEDFYSKFERFKVSFVVCC